MYAFVVVLNARQAAVTTDCIFASVVLSASSPAATAKDHFRPTASPAATATDGNFFALMGQDMQEARLG